MPYTPPRFEKGEFNCPLCGAYAHMTWGNVISYFEGSKSEELHFKCAMCAHCKKASLWYFDPSWGKGQKAINLAISGYMPPMVYPRIKTAPRPHPDMPESARRDYKEARQVASASPRAASALLRLAIQKLCAEIGGEGNNINADIAQLVRSGLSVEIQQALDIIRVVGNNAVHPGELDADDIADVASSLFELTNAIVEEMISKPKKMEALYERLPKGSRDAIEKRDAKDVD